MESSARVVDELTQSPTLSQTLGSDLPDRPTQAFHSLTLPGNSLSPNSLPLFTHEPEEILQNLSAIKYSVRLHILVTEARSESSSGINCQNVPLANSNPYPHAAACGSTRSWAVGDEAHHGSVSKRLQQSQLSGHWFHPIFARGSADSGRTPHSPSATRPTTLPPAAAGNHHYYYRHNSIPDPEVVYIFSSCHRRSSSCPSFTLSCPLFQVFPLVTIYIPLGFFVYYCNSDMLSPSTSLSAISNSAEA